jgi:DNA-binding transcriptional MerR regulator
MMIGDLSLRSGIHVETIRYYERVGVLPSAERHSNGRRIYEDHDVKRLRFVGRARALGFDLADVRALLDLQERPGASCEMASALAAGQLAAVESRIASLEKLRRELTDMIGKCRKGVVAECRVIEALSSEPGAVEHVIQGHASHRSAGIAITNLPVR